MIYFINLEKKTTYNIMDDRIYISPHISLKLVIKYIINQCENIFIGNYDFLVYTNLLEAFNRLTREASDLNKNLALDLKEDIIESGICYIARNFGRGLPVLPYSMNLLISAIQVYNATNFGPYVFDAQQLICNNITLYGLLFLSNIISDVVKAAAAGQQPLFSLATPPWQLTLIPARQPRPSDMSDMKHMPKIFIIHSHGLLPVLESDIEDPSLPVFKTPVMGFPPGSTGEAVSSDRFRKNRPVILKSRVDTFTSAKYGDQFWITLTDDPPQVTLINELSREFHSGFPTSKDAFRQIIQSTLCEIRKLTVSKEKQDSCRFRCHRVGRKISDIMLFCEGAPTVEGIIQFDTQTGDVEYVSEQFGLMNKVSVEEYKMPTTYTEEEMEQIAEAKAKSEQELADMIANPVDFKGKSFQMYSKAENIKKMDIMMRNMSRFSTFVSSEHGERVRLSQLIDVGISKGIIDPETDFVVVLSCRSPEHDLPLGALSPRSDSDSAVSQGGRRNKSRNRHTTKTKNKSKTKILKK